MNAFAEASAEFLRPLIGFLDDYERYEPPRPVVYSKWIVLPRNQGRVYLSRTNKIFKTGSEEAVPTLELACISLNNWNNETLRILTTIMLVESALLLTKKKGLTLFIGPVYSETVKNYLEQHASFECVTALGKVPSFRSRSS